MIRSLHRWFGLVAAGLLIVIALSGTALSVFPVAEGFGTPAPQAISVAELAARVQAAEPTVEQIRRQQARTSGGETGSWEKPCY